MSDSLVVDERTAELTKINDYRARKLLTVQRDGKLSTHARDLSRGEIQDLLTQPNASQVWEHFVLNLQLVHHNPRYINSITAEQVFSHWVGATAAEATGDFFRGDLCTVAAEIISENQVKYPFDPKTYSTDYFLVHKLMLGNPDFQQAMIEALARKKINSYVALTSYKGIRGLASFTAKQVLTLMKAMAESQATIRENDGYSEILEVLDGCGDPRQFVELAIAKATELGMKLEITDALRLAYLFYYKRYEYLQVSLDLRSRAAKILSTNPQFTPTEAAMIEANLNLHDHHVMQYGEYTIRKCSEFAATRGFQRGQLVYFPSLDHTSDKEGTLVTFRPSRSTPGGIVVIVQCADGLHDIPLDKLIPPTDPAAE